MKQLILCIGVIILFAGNTSAQEGKDSVITWNAGYKLSWNDFHAKPVPHKYYTAISACGISFEMPALDSLVMYAYFNKKRSWVTVKDSIGLLHENGHFDVTELVVRMFRKEYQQLKQSKRKVSMKQLNSLVERVAAKLEEYQVLYDTETGYSTNISRQQYWLERIANELQALESYSRN